MASTQRDRVTQDRRAVPTTDHTRPNAQLADARSGARGTGVRAGAVVGLERLGEAPGEQAM